MKTLKNTKQCYKYWLTSENYQWIDKDSAEYELALSQYGMTGIDDIYYLDFLEEINKQ